MALVDHIEDLVSRYSAGESLQAIGSDYGVTRERVRQLLSKRGINKTNGGFLKRAKDKAAACRSEKKFRRDERAIKTYGCTYSEVKRLNDGLLPSDTRGIALAFVRKRINARRKDKSLIWTLTFPEFVALWEQSGLPRGLASESGATVLLDPAKGYVAGNVYVARYGDYVSAMRHAEAARGSRLKRYTTKKSH